MSNLSVTQILLEAQRTATRVKDLDALGSALLVEAESNNRLVESLRKFQDDVDSLNRITNSKSNTDMVNRIQQQNANSSEILKENRELKICIEDYERAMDLIMQKYREHASSRIIESKSNFKEIYNDNLWKVIREQREKINEMAAVMHHAASIDDAAINRDQEIMSRLHLENKTLRELLEISRQFGSATRPLGSNVLHLEEKGVQTEADDSADELSISGASVEHINNNNNNNNNDTVIHLNSSNNMNSSISTADDDVPLIAATTENSIGDSNNKPQTINAVPISSPPTSSEKSSADLENNEDKVKTANLISTESTAKNSSPIPPNHNEAATNAVGENHTT